MKRILSKLREKKGTSMLWPVCMLLSGIIILSAVIIITTTFTTASAAKSAVERAGMNAITAKYNAQYGNLQNGFSIVTVSSEEVLSQLKSMGYAINGSNAVKKVSMTETYEMDNIKASVISENSDSSINTVEIQFTFSKPILFGGKVLPPVKITETVYAHPVGKF
jgi:hypothetical protein